MCPRRTTIPVTRVPTINELLSISLQSAQGSIATPATADIIQFLKCDLDPAIENYIREDKGLGHSIFGYVGPSKQTAKWSADMYAVLADGANPVVAPAFENLLLGAFGASAAVSFNDTVQASPVPTSTVFAVSSAASLKVGDSLAVNVGGGSTWQMRPITSIASNTLTFGAGGFSSAPASTNAVIGRIYRLSSAVQNFFTIVNWLRDQVLATSNISRMAVDAVVNDLALDCSQNIVTLSASGPASFVVEKQSPATGTYNGTFPTIPSLPTNWLTGYQVETPYLNGEIFLDTTALTAYSAKMAINNNAKQLPVAFGTQFADGVMFGQRRVNLDLICDGNSANYAYLLDAEQKNSHVLFFHTGQTQGQFIGVYCPKMFLGLNDLEKNDVTVRLNFTNSLMAASAADNEITLSIA